MLGAQGKAALERGISRNPDFTGRDAEAVAAVIRDNLQDSTKQFAKIHVQVVPVIERPEQEAGAKILNILKITQDPATLLSGRTVPYSDSADSDIADSDNSDSSDTSDTSDSSNIYDQFFFFSFSFLLFYYTYLPTYYFVTTFATLQY